MTGYRVMNVKNDLHILYERLRLLYSVQIVFNVHNTVNLKILTVNPYMNLEYVII